MPTSKDGKVIFNNDEIYDQTQRASSVLQQVLESEEFTQPEGALQIPEVDVRTARTARPVIVADSGRTTSRVLFVTSDQSVLLKNSATQREYIELAAFFDEVHILVLVKRNGTDTSIRAAPRVWLYPVHNPYWWKLPFAARSEAEALLVFNGAVRPDLIVGTDPFEAGYAAYLIAKSFARPFQIHVHEDFTDSAFRSAAPANKWRVRLAKHVLNRTGSVRAGTTEIAEMLQKRFSKITDQAVLPHFYNFAGYLDAVPAFDLHERYKDFAFIALTFGSLTADSSLHDVFSALHQMLKNPRIGLIVIGEGPAKKLFEEKTALLGITKSVVFVPFVEDMISVMKTADVVIIPDTDLASDEVLMRAAAAGLPIIAVRTPLRADVFKDGESSFLCEERDISCMTQKFSKLLNTPSLRKQFSRLSMDTVRNRVVEDPMVYYQTLRDTIEVVLGTGEAGEYTEAVDSSGAAEGERAIGPDGVSYPVTPLPTDQKEL